jgi:plastocyanin
VVPGRRIALGRRARPALIAVSVGVLAALLLPGPAAADNRRIALGNYQWSDRELELDLGEHVRWYWIGPDTMHSITGTSPDAAGMDSDPGSNFPDHPVGDEFQLDFDAPGVYEFHCKLHSTVRGTVMVSNQPGDPNAEPDPVPESAVDLTPPNIQNMVLGATAFGRRGTALRYSADEKARLDADIYELRPGKRPRYAGYSTWKPGHIGFNSVRFGVRRKHFKAKPGKYKARITAIDQSANSTRPVEHKFKIWPRKRKK